MPLLLKTIETRFLNNVYTISTPLSSVVLTLSSSCTKHCKLTDDCSTVAFLLIPLDETFCNKRWQQEHQLCFLITEGEPKEGTYTVWFPCFCWFIKVEYINFNFTKKYFRISRTSFVHLRHCKRHLIW